PCAATFRPPGSGACSSLWCHVNGPFDHDDVSCRLAAMLWKSTIRITTRSLSLFWPTWCKTTIGTLSPALRRACAIAPSSQAGISFRLLHSTANGPASTSLVAVPRFPLRTPERRRAVRLSCSFHVLLLICTVARACRRGRSPPARAGAVLHGSGPAGGAPARRP